MADKPVTREEKYLAYLTGDYKGELPKPITRKEKYLYELCLKGIGGEISPEEIKNAVNEYLEKNPVKPGATAEQAQQIEQNKTDISSLKVETSSLKEDLAYFESNVYGNDLDAKNETLLDKTTNQNIIITKNGNAGSVTGCSYSVVSVIGGEWYRIIGKSKITSWASGIEYGLYAFYMNDSWSAYIPNTVYVTNNTKETWDIIVQAPSNAKFIRFSNGNSEGLNCYKIPKKEYVGFGEELQTKASVTDLTKVANDLADVFDVEKNYKIDDCCIYDSVLYIANTDTVAGSGWKSYKWNKITVEELLDKKYKREIEFFNSDCVLRKDGSIINFTNGYVTNFIEIDKSNKIIAKRLYASASTTSMKMCALAYYDKDLKFIGYGESDGTGIKDFTVEVDDIPTNAVYMRASSNSANIPSKDWSLENGEMLIHRIVNASYAMNVLLEEKDAEIQSEINSMKELSELNRIADKYETTILQRELYLRQTFKYSGDDEHWYGAEWTETENADNVTGIYSNGDESLLTALPIQNKMRRCVYKDGKVVYYLDSSNSELKADGTSANLDGTDGNVMVEIPEFFYKFEVTESDGIRTVKLKLSEQGIDGFNYSPKQYVGAYEATVNHDTDKLASVCTTLFTRNTEDVKISSEDDYIVGNYSIGTHKTAVRCGFTSNATIYRGATNDSTFDENTNPSESGFCRNQLGLPLSRINRKSCRDKSNMKNGELMYQYDTQKILWMLSMVEFRNRDIRAALGVGATVYPSYDAYENYFVDSHGVGRGGLSVIPCGVTNSLGNGSGTVYYKMPQVPVTHSNNGSNHSYTFADVWMPCVSYRGVEHFYGHLYKIADQVTIKSKNTGVSNPTFGNKNLYDVTYWYHRNPFTASEERLDDDIIWNGQFTPAIAVNSKLLFGYDGHILPIECANGIYNGRHYADCAEYSDNIDAGYATFNGRIVSGSLVGRSFIVSVYDSTSPGRANDGTRIVCYAGVN